MAEETGSTNGSRGNFGDRTIVHGGDAAFVALKSGLAIRQYVIEEVIGAGGFGITYRARHQKLASKVFALKEFFPRQFATRSGTHVVSTADGDGLFRWGLDRFLKEAEALAKCEHAGIVDVVDYFEENGTAYAVLGYVEGKQLGQWLDALGRPPTQSELDRILMPLLEALEVVHGATLLHRDIAPDNIIVRRDGSPCLIDFGACREDIRERSRKISAIVKHGYSPPEQYHGIAELQGPWTDIYAVGATLYRALSGSAPVDSSRRGALGDTLRPASEVARDAYRGGFLAAVDMSMRLKPEDRPQSIGQWREMLLSETTSEESQLQPAGGAATGGKAPRSRGATDRTKSASTVASDVAQAPLVTTGPRLGPRRGVVLALAAVLGLTTLAAIALWRGSQPSYPQAGTSPPSATAQPVPKQSPPSLATSPPAVATAIPDPEAAAARAWAVLVGTGDISAIERFVAEHPNTRAADSARVRLAELRETARRREQTEIAAIESKEAAEKATAAIARQARLDLAWNACQQASEAQKAAPCAPVIDGEDTAARRSSALHWRGNASRLAANYREAILDLSRALELEPRSAQILNDRGIAYFLLGDPENRAAGIRDYEAAIRIEPRHAEALNNRAWALLQAGRASDALSDANRSIEANPTNGYAYDTRGQIMEALGRRDDAIRDYERALAIDSSQETSRAGLARLRGTGR